MDKTYESSQLMANFLCYKDRIVSQKKRERERVVCVCVCEEGGGYFTGSKQKQFGA